MNYKPSKDVSRFYILWDVLCDIITIDNILATPKSILAKLKKVYHNGDYNQLIEVLHTTGYEWYFYITLYTEC